MWFNGIITVVDLALKETRVPGLAAHRDAILWGALREDVWCLPIVRAVVPNPSLSHFERTRGRGGFIPLLTPSARVRAQKCAVRALALHAQGDEPRAWIQLGRAAHALIDMACPVHAQGRVHTADPYEWAVEAMAEELRDCAVPPVESAASFGEITANLARAAQRVNASGVRAAEARHQASQLVPLAAGHLARFLELYADRARASRPISPAPCEIAAALEMPQASQRRWCGQLRRWAEAHGGARHYARLMELAQSHARTLEANAA